MLKNLQLLTSILLLCSSMLVGQTCKEVIGYYPGWQWYDRAKLVNPTTIQYSKYDILNYAFFKPNADGSIEGTDSWADENVLKGQINWSTTPTSYYANTSLVDLAHAAGTKVLISVGGWTLSDLFPSIAANATKRANFAHHCRLLVTEYNLDGIDLDWEYPGYAVHNGSPADKANFTQFVKQIRDTLNSLSASTNETYLLTSCFGASQANMSNIDWPNVLPHLDAINLMSYDFFGTWDANTNHNAPLTAPTQGDPTFNITSAVSWLMTNHNVPASKINAGVAFYGRSHKTVGTPGLHVPGTGTADTGTFFEDDGSPSYYNVMKNIGLFSQQYDAIAQAPYLTGNAGLKTFVSYDNPASITAKGQYIVSQNLRGAIIWEITGDYMETSPGSGIIAGTPLLDALNTAFCSVNNASPTVNISAPINNSNFYNGATINISATANDSDGTISKVEFYDGNVKIGEDLSSPYSFAWTGASLGAHSLKAKAIDNLNASTTSATVNINVLANTPPTCTLTAPLNNTNLAGPVTTSLKATATDANGTISKVEFYNGTTLLGTDLTSPYAYLWTSAPVGLHSISAKSYDNNGASTTSAVASLNIYSNTPPTVTMTAPSTNSFFIAGNTINLAASASDAQGTVTKVVFYNGATILGTDLTAPYTFSWANAPVGVYSSIRARAYDNNNASAYSPYIKVTVLAVGSNLPPTVSFTSPLNNSTHFAPASITLSANASDTDGTISKVRFYNGATLLNTDVSAPYSFVWNNVAAGTYNSVKAIAYDNLNVSNTATISITVLNNQAPTVTLNTPTNASTYYAPASINLDATAADNDGTISKVEFYNGTNLLATDNTAPYNFAWTNVVVGNYAISAKAYDNYGMTSISSVNNITVTEAPTAVTCSSPSSFYFTNNNYIPLGEIKVGQGRLHPVWGVSADAYIPDNRMNWAISMVHAAHLFRNVTGTDKIPVDFYFATAAKESFCGCDQGMQTAAGQAYPFTFQASSLGDGCFQIEGNSAYNELIQEYPQRFPTGQHSNLIGNHNYETASLSKAYYDIFTIKYWEVHKGWNPIQFFNTAADPNASIKLMAVAYNRGLWYTGLGTVLNTDRNNAIVNSNISPYFTDNSYGYDYQNALTNYCRLLTNNGGLLDASLTANNPATNLPYNYFANYYNPQVNWSDINNYIDSIAIMYPEVNFTTVKNQVQATFNSINSGNSISFRYQLGQVLNSLMLLLPADDPTTNIATIYGCSTGSTGGGATCSSPSALSTSNITVSGASISWTGTASSYIVQYKASNTSTWTSITCNSASCTLTGLAACTAYDYQIQAVCNANSSSTFTSANFTTIGCANACNVPSNLTVSNINNGGATLNWTAVSGAASYNIQYKASTASTWTSISSSSPSATLSGLSTCTPYSVKVRTICAANASSAYSNESTFSTTGCGTPGPPPSTYCSAYSLTSSAEWVQSISLGTYTNNSGNNSGFGNFMDQTITVQMGTTIALSLTPGFPSGSSQDEYWKVWIDFNRDGDLTDAGEEVFSNHGSGIFNSNVTIPTNASYGYSRCRFAMKRGVYPEVCEVYNNGEAEDYQILFNPATAALQFNPSSLVHNSISNVSIFPNPGKDAFSLQFSLVEDATIQLEMSDLYGSLVHQEILGDRPKGTQIIDIQNLSNLANGIYFVSLRKGDTLISTVRWVKL